MGETAPLMFRLGKMELGKIRIGWVMDVATGPIDSLKSRQINYWIKLYNEDHSTALFLVAALYLKRGRREDL